MSNSESEFTLKDGVLRFKCEPEPFCTRVRGPIINSFPGGRQGSARRAWNEARQAWKEKVTRAVKDERGGAQWIPEHLYAVTLQFRFHPRPTPLDVDNFVKPVLDGLRDGLCVDDSNFRTLLIRRLPDLPDDKEPEEVRLFVSSTEPDAGHS